MKSRYESEQLISDLNTYYPIFSAFDNEWTEFMRGGEYEKLRHDSALREITFEAHSTASYLAGALALYADPHGTVSLPDYVKAVDSAIGAQFDCSQLLVRAQAEPLDANLSEVRNKIIRTYQAQLPHIDYVKNLTYSLKRDPRYLAHIDPASMKIYSSIKPSPIDVILEEIKAWRSDTELHSGRGEVELRAQLVNAMVRRGLNATSETRSFNGHADIVVKDEKCNFEFVAECKVWGGSSNFHDAINQLRDRYLSTEVKTGALVIFSRLKNFLEVPKSSIATIENHPGFAGWETQLDEFGFGYFWLMAVQQNNIKIRTAVILANLYDGR